MSYEFGKWINRKTPMTEVEASDLCNQSIQHQEALQKYPFDKIETVLLKAAELWNDADSKYRRQAQETLPRLTGFSAEMIQLGLQELGSMLNPEGIRKKLKTELKDIPLSHGYTYDRDSERLLQYRPLGTLFHVLSGNVFLVGPGSFLQGLITRNVSILKMSSTENFFMPLFMESISEVDTDKVVAQSIALVEIPSKNTSVIEVFKKAVDGIIIWGGEEAVQAYRNNVPARTRVITFGPKLSFSWVTQQGLAQDGISSVAHRLAKEMAIWDQNACTAPQVCYVENEESAKQLAEALTQALESFETQWPAGHLSPDAAVEIRKLRGVAEVSEAKGEGLLREPSQTSLRWTIIVSKELELEPSPLHRTIRLLSYSHFHEVEKAISLYRGYLQTVGIIGSCEEFKTISAICSRYGAQRIFPLGGMLGGDIDDPHDGQYDLPLMLNLIVIRPDTKTDAWEFLNPKERREFHNQKFRELIRQAKQSDYYKEALHNIPFDTIEDLKNIPLLTREQWESSMLPFSQVLQTRIDQGGYVTRSGGSTGIPKYSYFDQKDWEAMSLSAQRIFHRCGFNKNDRLANFMLSGDLYGSFISFNHINYNLGMQSFCFGSATDPHMFLDILKKFNINAVQGIVPTLMKLLRGAHQIDSTLKIEKVMYAGQAMSQNDQQWLREVLGTKILTSIIGTTEANHIAYQCPYLEGDFHHLAEDYNYFEIIDEDDKPISKNSIGRLVVSGLHKHNYPVLRYLIGDSARFIDNNCACGSQDRIIEYKGRWDDILCISQMNLKYSDIRKSLESLPISEIQIIGQWHKEKEVVLIRVESHSTDFDLLKNQIYNLLITTIPELHESMNKKLFNLSIEVLKQGSIARNPRTGKIKSMLDERTSHV